MLPVVMGSFVQTLTDLLLNFDALTRPYGFSVFSTNWHFGSFEGESTKFVQELPMELQIVEQVNASLDNDKKSFVSVG